MKELIVKDKQKYLDENNLFVTPLKITDKKRCIHCDSIITVGDYQVYTDKRGEEYICCPNAPECNGTIIDWMPDDKF